MSSRALASVFNVSQATVLRDISKAESSGGVKVVRGLDGKAYTLYSREDRWRLIGLVHDLRHDGLAIRAIAAELTARRLRCSVGTIHTYLTSYRCARCSGDANALT